MENKHEQLKQIGQKETTVNLIIKEIKSSIENGTYKADNTFIASLIDVRLTPISVGKSVSFGSFIPAL